jgi:ubiquinone/menaquinone biosynthesis C-methylase UbiE
MARTDYSGWMATAYDAGRSLSAEALDVWGDAAHPFLRAGDPAPVLDLGAGTGRFSGCLAQWSGGGVVAVEPAAAMARTAQSKQLAEVEVVVGSAEAIPLAPATVKAVWMSQVVHHFDDLERAAGEIARVLRPGGHVLLRGAFPDEAGGIYRDYRVYQYFPAARQCWGTFPDRRRVLEAFGFAGLMPVFVTQVSQVTAPSLRDLYARVATRADTTLATLDDATFAAGLALLAHDVEAEAEAFPQPVIDRLDLLVLTQAPSR